MIERSYRRDEGNRLVCVDGDTPESFVFDPAGNILGSDADGGTGAAIGDRLLIRGDARFEYDGCGNRIREVRGAGGNVERLYRYRADNQLAAVEERSRRGRRVTSFAYDALGRRTEKRSTAWGPAAANDGPTPAPTTTRTDFVWSGNVLLAESSTTATDDAPVDPLATVYLHEPGSFRPLAQIRRATPAGAGTIFHYQLDHLGTPQEVTNDDGRIVWQARLKAWGAVARTVVEEVAQPIRFQGQYHDVETGLHYNRFRYYTPEDGCFVHQDPIGLIGGYNFAIYVNAPTLAIDPSGLCAVSPESSGVGSIIKTPYGPALQSTTPEALAARQQVTDGATLYRTGTMGKSQAAEAQFWSLENPSSPGYAQRYGIPEENVANADFVETAKIKPGTSFETRPAPAVGSNLGGGIEVVTESNGVNMSYFGTR